MIVLEKVSRSYSSVRAVEGVSLSVEEGLVYGIIGKSGAGKSTLLRLMSLMEKPDSGRILYRGDRVDELTGGELLGRRRKIGMIFQGFNLFSSRSAAGNVAYPLEIAGMPKRHIASRVDELLELVGIADKRDARMSELSGGQKQRVAIARSLAAQPEVLFCDEATSALDPQTTRSILDLLRSLRDRLGLTVVMITHQMEVVRDACDRVAVLEGGRVAEEGTVRDVFASPKSAITRELIGELKPLEDAELERGLPGDAPVQRLRLRFEGKVTDEPVLSRLAKSLPVELNILSGTVHRLGAERLGELIVELSGPDEARKEAVDRLVKLGVGVEDLIDA